VTFLVDANVATRDGIDFEKAGVEIVDPFVS
jgi:hypothetical protein